MPKPLNNKDLKNTRKVYKLIDKYFNNNDKPIMDLVNNIHKIYVKTTNQKLKIDITTIDCEDLKSAVEFDWIFTTNKGENIDVHLFNPDAK